MLWLSQTKYIEHVLKCFNMKCTKVVTIPLASHLKLRKKIYPTTKEEKVNVVKVPYSLAVGSLMYLMVCTIPDIAHTIIFVIMSLENREKNIGK